MQLNAQPDDPMPLAPYRPDPRDTLLWNSPMVRFGTFAVAAGDPEFETAGQIGSSPTVVFPRGTVRIALEGEEPFVADAATTVFYNVGHPYRRQILGPDEDCADFFHFDHELLAESLWESGLGETGDPERPFGRHRTVADAGACALQRRVVRHARRSGAPDSLLIEESMLRVLKRTLLRLARGRSKAAASSGATRRLAERAREILALRFDEGNLTLERIAAEVGCSVYHLCRVFRSETGTTLHRYRHQLRITAALARVAEGDDLATVAADLGYASHSHFTERFHRTFGMTPSSYRRLAPGGSARRG